MKSMIDRLIKYRYNKDLIKNVFKAKNTGRMSGDHVSVIDKCSSYLLLTFIIRFFSRVYIEYNNSNLGIIDYVKNNFWGLLILFLIYTLFVNYLLGVGFKDKRIRLFSNKFVYVLGMILIYQIEIVVSLIFFINKLYDFYGISLVSLLSIPLSLFCYFGIFVAILDFILYSTDNSSAFEGTESERVDYFWGE